jgi:pyridoxal 5'-phosphate synthase pdxT subunit
LVGRLRIGVLAVQGNVREHVSALELLGADAVEVRKPEELSGLDGLVIPGGESTTFMRLMRLYGLDEAIRRFRGPIFGTCAGMIVLDRGHLGLVDLEVERNAYGRQVASFEADLRLAGEAEPLRGVFIRAPRVADAGPGVQVLAELDGEPVLLREGRFLVASFHPELTGDTRVHELFLDLVREESLSRPSDAPLGVRRDEGQYSNTALGPERGQRREGGGGGVCPAGAARSGGRDVRA